MQITGRALNVLLCFLIVGGTGIPCQAQWFAAPSGGLTGGSVLQVPGVNFRAYLFQHNKPFCFGPEFSVFWPKKEVHQDQKTEKHLLELNLNGHYLIHLNEYIVIYPLSGLNYTHEKKVVTQHKATRNLTHLKGWGVNYGLGLHYHTERFAPFIEFMRPWYWKGQATAESHLFVGAYWFIKQGIDENEANLPE